MSKPSRDDVMKAAREAGFDVHPRKNQIRSPFDFTGESIDEHIERFAAAMYAAGAEDMRERAARAANGFKIQTFAGNSVYAQAAIRALPINTEGEQG